MPPTRNRSEKANKRVVLPRSCNNSNQNVSNQTKGRLGPRTLGTKPSTTRERRNENSPSTSQNYPRASTQPSTTRVLRYENIPSTSQNYPRASTQPSTSNASLNQTVIPMFTPPNYQQFQSEQNSSIILEPTSSPVSHSSERETPVSDSAHTLSAIPLTGNPFGEIVNLRPYFQSHCKGAFLLPILDNPTTLIEKKIICESVNISVALLLNRTKTMKFGPFKKDTLHNICQSLIQTFPRLAIDGEGNDKYVRILFIC